MANEGTEKRIVAFDFDGVIASYSGFRGKEDVQPPITAVVESMRRLKAAGHTIIIYSTRGDDFLRKYLLDHDIPFDHINMNPDKAGNNPGKPVANVYVDDRAVCYRGQGPDELVEEILKFRPHWK